MDQKKALITLTNGVIVKIIKPNKNILMLMDESTKFINSIAKEQIPEPEKIGSFVTTKTPNKVQAFGMPSISGMTFRYKDDSEWICINTADNLALLENSLTGESIEIPVEDLGRADWGGNQKSETTEQPKPLNLDPFSQAKELTDLYLNQKKIDINNMRKQFKL